MKCLVCNAHSVTKHLDAGSHPVSSFFLTQRNAPERAFNLSLGQCSACGTIQAIEPVPHTALVPPYDWLFAREPEEHLDTVVDQILALPGITTSSVIGALTSKDDTTVDRFRAKGFTNTWRVSVKDDLGVDNPAANIETVQRLTEPGRMVDIARRRGAADVLFVRHILEHAEDIHAFVAGISALVKPGGVIMVEVPDCTASLKLHDYAMIWEEHSLYLTPATFSPLLQLGGFEEIRTDIYPLPFENSLVYIGRKSGEAGSYSPSPVALAEVGLLASYAKGFAPITAQLRSYLERVKREKGPIALFGAGHLACAFVNFHGLADLVDFVADDTPQKQGLFLPGARLPILPSAEMVTRKVALCILALSISNEDRVIERNVALTEAGGTFCSIFAASNRSIRKLIA